MNAFCPPEVRPVTEEPTPVMAGLLVAGPLTLLCPLVAGFRLSGSWQLPDVEFGVARIIVGSTVGMCLKLTLKTWYKRREIIDAAYF